MAGYSKGIVDTRKLNKDNKAKLGRRGDTKIREVDNRESHVNALEAYLIDVNGKAGEEYAKRVGAGTVNPLTGMPEYHEEKDNGVIIVHTHDEDSDEIIYQDPSKNLDSEVTPVDYSYEGLKDVTSAQLTKFDASFGAEDVKYFQDIFTDKPFDFLKKGAGLEKEQLGTTFGRGYQESTAAKQQAISQSGLKSSGAITGAFEKQIKGLTQDYQAGMKGTQLGLEEGVYSEQQRQLDEYWDMITMRQQAG